ncbi:MAG TPA: hypothetical protein VMS88_06605, partial [Terriglobales bacterium]|nr:hypothetical protein [Terriglobales bacterium]
MIGALSALAVCTSLLALAAPSGFGARGPLPAKPALPGTIPPGAHARAGKATHARAKNDRENNRLPLQARVLLLRIDGAISPVTAEALGNAVDRAEQGEYRALVLLIDTPGGLESSMRDMVKRILVARVPIIAYVSPSGARAASAGVFIVMAADIAAMAPGTNIGAATPVNLQGGMDSTMARKATSDAAAFARTVARQRGRNVQWAEQAVRQ